MNKQILMYLFNTCFEAKDNEIKLPSIRWLAKYFALPCHEITKILHYYQTMGVIKSIQGSKNILFVNQFQKTFKNNSNQLFASNIKRKILTQSIRKLHDFHIHSYYRSFTKNQKVVMLSVDHLYLDRAYKDLNLNNGVDHFIKSYIPGHKTSFKKVSVIDISQLSEFKILQVKYCIMDENIIKNQNHELISHSFSIYPINFFQDFKIEMLL